MIFSVLASVITAATTTAIQAAVDVPTIVMPTTISVLLVSAITLGGVAHEQGQARYLVAEPAFAFQAFRGRAGFTAATDGNRMGPLSRRG